MSDEMWQQRIYDRVPGFQDYLRRDVRAAADKLLRSYIARELRTQRDVLSELEVELMGRSDRRSFEVDRAVMELQLVIDRVGALDSSDAPWVKPERLREEDLELLHRSDAILLRNVDRLAGKVTEIVGRQSAVHSFAFQIGDILITLREMMEKLERRTEVIQSPLA